MRCRQKLQIKRCVICILKTLAKKLSETFDRPKTFLYKRTNEKNPF